MKRTHPPISGTFIKAAGGTAPSQSAYGVVEFSGERATIAFHPPTTALGSREDFPATLWLLSDGEVLAVVSGCLFHSGNGDGSVRTVAVQRAVRFHHSVDDVPSEFEEATVRIKGLREWTGFSLGQADAGVSSFTLSAKAGELDCRVYMGVSQGGTYTKEHRKVSGSLKLSSGTPREIDYWLDQIHWFGWLVSIFAESACVNAEITLDTATETAELWVPTIEVPDNMERHPRMWIFTLQDVSPPERERIIERWYAARPRVEVLNGMFIEEWLRPAQILESKFISLMQGLEAYCRQVFVGKDTFLLPDEYGKLHKILVAAIPPGTAPHLKDSLKARLHFGNEHSLRKRVQTLLLAHPEASDLLMPVFGTDLKSWVKRTVDMRNAITHYSLDPEEFQRMRKGLFETVQEVRVLIHYLLLNEALGSSAEALDVLTKTRGYKEIEFRRDNRKASDNTPAAAPV